MFIQAQGYTSFNDVHWVDCDHTEMGPSPSKQKRMDELKSPRPHKSGSARTEGYYKLDSTVKPKPHFSRCENDELNVVCSFYYIKSKNHNILSTFPLLVFYKEIYLLKISRSGRQRASPVS